MHLNSRQPQSKSARSSSALKTKCNKAPLHFHIIDQALGTITKRTARLFGKGACNKVCTRSINAGLWCPRSEKPTLQIATGFGLETSHPPRQKGQELQQQRWQSTENRNPTQKWVKESPHSKHGQVTTVQNSHRNARRAV